MMRLAYNTNGLAHHDLLDAIELLANIGYQGVSITLDHGALNPFDHCLEDDLLRISTALSNRGLDCVVETGARYLLNPRIKHEPTLVSPDARDRARRVDFLCRAIDIAARLEARCVSLWSGVVRDGAGRPDAVDRLEEGLAAVLEHADANSMDLAFEPEPGMLIDTVAAYDDLLTRLVTRSQNTNRLKLTIDIGHLQCLQELPISSKVRESSARLANVHIEDMNGGIHEHLMFGEGEIDFPPVIAALAEIRYDGLLSVELSRHSHEGPSAAQRAYDFLRPLVDSATGKST